MNCSTLEVASFVSQTILSVCSLTVAAIALLVSFKTYYYARLPIMGICFRRNEDYIFLEITNHGNGIARNMHIDCSVFTVNCSRTLNFVPPNSTVSIELMSTTAWNHIAPQHQQIECSYSYFDQYKKKHTVNNIDLLFH